MAARNSIAGEKIRYLERDVEVAPACDPNASGNHYCATHEEGFANNFSVNSHVEEPGEHVLVWLCFRHGPEHP